MKIQEVHIKEFKVLSDFNADLNGQNILLVADNGRGKSSFMQFVQIALGRQDIVPPNSDGSGTVVAEKDGKTYTFEVKIRDGKPTITVKSADGLKDNRKGVIAAIVGANEFDINEFVKLSESKAGKKKQIEIYKGFLPEEVQKDIAKYESEVENAFNERTFVNRQIKDLTAVVEANALYGKDLSEYKHTDTSELAKKLSDITKKNSEIKNVSEMVDNRLNQINEIETQIKQLTEKIEVLKKANEESILFLSKNEITDTSAIQNQINEASVNNENFNQAKQLKENIDKLNALKKSAEEFDHAINSTRQLISDTIKQIDSPVDGLSFDEEGLVYNGIPVDIRSLSTSEIIEIGVRMKLSENPDMPLFIEHGESIGKERYETLLNIAKKINAQVIMEQVQRGKEELSIEIIPI